MIYLSQKQAQILLRAEGFPVASAKAEVARLKKYRFGQRDKVKSADVEALIREANRPSEPVRPTGKIRGFRPEILRQIQG